jgi:hypothetical protein
MQFEINEQALFEQLQDMLFDELDENATIAIKCVIELVKKQVELALKSVKPAKAADKKPETKETKKPETKEIKKTRVSKKKAEESTGAEPPAKKRKTTKKTATGEPKPKRDPSKYARFTGMTNTAYKAVHAGNEVDDSNGFWSQEVTLTFEKTSESVQKLLENDETGFFDQKGEKMTLEEAMKAAAEVVIDEQGKVHMMRLTSLLWAAIGNKVDFMDGEAVETADSDEADA